MTTRVLVTGGAGFIGSHLVDALLLAGHEVGVVDDLSTGSLANIPADVWLREMDILDEALAVEMNRFAPEIVVHLAAQSSVAGAIRDPQRDRAVNVDGTSAVARAAARAGVRLVVSASSAAVYGDPASLPLTERAPKVPTNPYGESKLEAERILAEQLATTGVDFASMRFANVYGPRQDAGGEGGVVAIFASAMLAGRPPVVHGSGSQTRDFIFVGDVAQAVLSAIGRGSRLAGEGGDDAAYNISTGVEATVEELLGHMRSIARYDGPEQRAPAREGDIVRSVLDPSKAMQALRWQATTPLAEGLSATLTAFAREV